MKNLIFICTIVTIFLCCTSKSGHKEEIYSGDLASRSWDEIVVMSRGQSLNMMMWQGDPLINQYIKGYIAKRLKENYDISLNVINGQGNIIVQTMLAEDQAQKEVSSIDLMWINGETFYQLREIEALYGPWVDRLPNAQFIDFENPFIGTDFQQPIDGYECPWGNVQMTIIYNSKYVKNPPRTVEELKEFTKNNPYKFTIDHHFTGLTFLKSLFIHFAGGSDNLAGPFDEEIYSEASNKLWEYMNEIKPFLWRKGEAFPQSVAQLHQLFAREETWFTMSNNDSEVDNKMIQGIFPQSARAYVPDFGSIQNSHYIGIAKNSSKKAAAMVVANELISPEAQWHKSDPKIWGDGTILSMDALPDAWKKRFNNIPNRQYAPRREDIEKWALSELAPEYMIRLAEDHRKHVILN